MKPSPSPADIFKFNDNVRRLVNAAQRLAAQGGVAEHGRDVAIYNSWHQANRLSWNQLGVLAGGVLPVTDELIYATLMQLHKRAAAQYS